VRFKSQNGKGIAVFLFLACFITVFLVSEALVHVLSSHEHEHKGADGTCGICYWIKNTENLFRQAYAPAVVGMLGLGFVFMAAVASRAALSFSDRQTLVSSKIRMDN